MEHFSHEHRLDFLDESENNVCYACGKPTFSNVFCCTKCGFYLHQSCAEADRTFQHPTHSQHPLSLYLRPPYLFSDCICDICELKWNRFTYYCKQCYFKICMSCVQEKECEFKHLLHKHPLTLMNSSALFHCDACDTETKDFSYVCKRCLFWIHRSCVLSPSEIKLSDHPHNLKLKSSLPRRFRRFWLIMCDLCNGEINPSSWVYCCFKCRYFAHIKCVAPPVQNRGGERENEVEDLDNNVLLFPLLGENVDPLSQFLKATQLGGDDKSTNELIHFSHSHPLVFSDVGSDDNQMKNDEICCDGCAQRIFSAPFYSCGQCNFFLHKSCANLPQTLPHHFHKHPLEPLMRPNLAYTLCAWCHNPCNGFVFGCKSCEFYLDVFCACAPREIEHRAHRHTLVQCEDIGNECYRSSSSCSRVGYKCKPSDFKLCINCCMLPEQAKHAWDLHALTLTYPPLIDEEAIFIVISARKR